MKNLTLIGLFLTGMLWTSCSSDDAPPPLENEEEVIDKVTLTFTPDGGGTSIVATAIDPDGEGASGFTAEAIALTANTTYTLAMTIENMQEGENITEEISTEDDEHMFFFSFTTDVFSNPTGNGNIDNRADALNYNDEDENGFPLGLSTEWTTGSSVADAEFRVILKHQPDLKSATSSSTNGETDVDITWDLSIN